MCKLTGDVKTPLGYNKPHRPQGVTASKKIFKKIKSLARLIIQVLELTWKNWGSAVEMFEILPAGIESRFSLKN